MCVLCARMCVSKDLSQGRLYECDSETAGQLIDTDSDSSVFQWWLWGLSPFSHQPFFPLYFYAPSPYPPCPPPTPMSSTPHHLPRPPFHFLLIVQSILTFDLLTQKTGSSDLVSLVPLARNRASSNCVCSKKKKLVQKSRNGWVTTAKPEIIQTKLFKNDIW